MAIDDPTALPQSNAQITEYMKEAEQFWNDNRTEEAHVLYRSVFNASEGSEASLAGYRVALYLQTTGDIDGALNFVKYTHEPGTHDLEIALRAAMPDQAVDPSEPPQTAEACERYEQSILNAAERSDWTTVEALTLAYQETQVDIGIGRHASNQLYRGLSLMHLGRNDEARPALEYALANSGGDNFVARAREALKQIGVHVDDGGNPYETEDSKHLLAGIAAFEGGDEAKALSELHIVVNSGDAGPSDRARAHFYLGSMAYHKNSFQEARGHIETAASDAPDPEQGWAKEMLSWRWQEN
jgi:tetratricopeptide (TPR) repeat protein